MNLPLKKSHKIIVIVITILMAVGIATTFTIQYGENVLKAERSQMKNTLTILNNKINQSGELLEFASATSRSQANLLDYIYSTLDGKNVSVSSMLLKTKEYMPNSKIYYCDKNFSVTTNESTKPELTTEQWKELTIKNKLLVDDGKDTTLDHVFVSHKYGDGYIIAESQQVTIPRGQSLFTGLPKEKNYYVADARTNEMLYSSNDALGKTMPEPLVEQFKDESQKDSEIKEGFTQADGLCYSMIIQKGNYYFGTYIDIGNIILNVLSFMIIPYILIAGSTLLLLIYFFRTRKAFNDNVKEVKKMPFAKDVYVNKKLLYRTIAMVVLVGIFELAFTAYTTEMSTYAYQNQISERSMELLTDNMKAYAEDEARIKNNVDEINYTTTSILAELVGKNTEAKSASNLQKMAGNTGLNTIEIYDGNGRLESSSQGYTGYVLTKDEKEAKSKAWEVLNSDKEFVAQDYNDGTCKRMCALKRKDATGVIVSTFDNEAYQRLIQLYSREEAIKTTDFGNATTFYIKVSDMDSTYVIQPDGEKVEITHTELPEKLINHNYTGMATIDNTTYYTNAKTSENISIVCAIPKSLVGDGILSNSGLIILWALIELILLIGCCRCDTTKMVEEKKEYEDFYENPYAMDENAIRQDKYFRRASRIVILGFLIGLVVMMAGISIGGMTLWQYLFSDVWDKGINIFALSLSIIIAAGTILVLYILKKFGDFVHTKLGSQTATVTKMVFSIMKVLLVILAICMILYQFGMDPVAILAGAGISGLVVGLASKDIVTDLIAGLFLIFEGHVHAGDWVQIGDWRGRIEEIGARVTLVRMWSSVKVFNNSNIRDYVNLNKYGDSAAIISIRIKPCDITPLFDIINEKAKSIREQLPHSTGDPWFSGLEDATDDWMQIRFGIMVPEPRIGSYSRRFKAICMDILKENGIELAPSNVITSAATNEAKTKRAVEKQADKRKETKINKK